jgi:hypothetical protein
MGRCMGLVAAEEQRIDTRPSCRVRMPRDVDDRTQARHGSVHLQRRLKPSTRLHQHLCEALRHPHDRWDRPARSGEEKVMPDMGTGGDSGIAIAAMVLNQDIGFVAEGQEAVIKFDAFPFTRYGTVPGKIKIVSEDAVCGGGVSQQAGEPAEVQSAKTGSSNPLFYAARVTLDHTTIKVDGKDVKLTPGMAATVEIKTGKRKLIEYLLSPLMRMTDEAGRER